MPKTTLQAAIDNVIEETSKRAEHGGVDVIGISTGFANLDEALGGFRNEALYVVGGRPGMGKSALGFTFATVAAQQQKRTLFLSMEMSAELLATRALSGITGIPATNIERGRVTPQEIELLRIARKSVEHLTFGIIDDRLDSDAFIVQMEQTQKNEGLDCLVVDYISLFRDSNRFGDTERTGRIIGNMHVICRSCKIPVIALAQLNREVEKRENHMPIMSDIRDSGVVEQDAFVVAFVYRPYYYEQMFSGAEPVEIEKDAKIIIAKNRQGVTGQLTAWFHPKQMRWTPKDTKLTLPPATNIEPTTLKERVQQGRM